MRLKFIKFLRKLVDFIIWVVGLTGILVLILVILGYKPITIQTGSMEPVLNVGDLCFIHEKGREYRYGDVVTFRVDDVFVTHRIAADNGDGTFVTKGDNNKVTDTKKITSNDIVGIVKFKVPKAGYVMASLSNINGKLVFISVLVWLFVLSFILEGIENKTIDILVDKELK